MTGAVALGELDGNPGLEVFATSWDDSNKAFVVRGDGSFLPGWPRNPDPTTAHKGYWASSAAVDVDGDGRAELFAPAKNGKLYAWHWDGTPLGATAAFKTGLGIYQVHLRPSRTSTPIPSSRSSSAHRTAAVHLERRRLQLPEFPDEPGHALPSNTAVGDVNNDGVLDVVMLTEGGLVNVFNTTTGLQLSGWPKCSSSRAPRSRHRRRSPTSMATATSRSLWRTTAAPAQPGSHPGLRLPGQHPRRVAAHRRRIQLRDLADRRRRLGRRRAGHRVRQRGRAALRLGCRRQRLAGFPLTVGDFIRSTPYADDVDGDGNINLVLSGWDKNVYVWNFPAAWHPEAAYWPTLKHDMHRSGSFGFVFDIAPPAPPTSLASPSHTAAGWSNDPTVDVVWSGAGDASGIGGYSYLWDTDSLTLPDETIDTLTESATSPPLEEGQSHWFHLRTVDTLGNWTSGALHLGPFWIDVIPPANSPSAGADRPTGTWSTDETIEVTWLAATDPVVTAKSMPDAPPAVAGSGIGGYSVTWDTDSLTVPDATVETESLGTTSPALADGNMHWFHLRAVDAAGNGADSVSTLHLGPFWVDATPPVAQVLSPNGGEGWAHNSVQTIRWLATDAGSGVQTIEIRYSTDGGTTFPNLVATAAPGDSTYDWTVPLDVTTTARMQIVVTDIAGHASSDASDADFGLTTAVDVATTPPVTRTWLEPAAPNPFNPSTTFRYSLLESARVRLAIYDVQGRLVRVLVDGWQAGPSRQEARWDGSMERGGRAPSGVYLAVFRAGRVEFTSRLVLAK